jgi:hypothetical protein
LRHGRRRSSARCSAAARGRSSFVVGLVGAIPPIFTIVGMLLVGANSDRTGERL